MATAPRSNTARSGRQRSGCSRQQCTGARQRVRLRVERCEFALQSLEDRQIDLAIRFGDHSRHEPQCSLDPRARNLTCEVRRHRCCFHAIDCPSRKRTSALSRSESWQRNGRRIAPAAREPAVSQLGWLRADLNQPSVPLIYRPSPPGIGCAPPQPSPNNFALQCEINDLRS
jgi:hypothetical protein